MPTKVKATSLKSSVDSEATNCIKFLVPRHLG